jgi:hypothetical protein
MGCKYDTHQGDKKAYRISIGKPEGKKSLGRPKHRWIIIFKWILM